MGNIYFTDVRFINNTADKGGAVSMIRPSKNDNNYFRNCTFIGNNATENGGSIWSGSYTGAIPITLRLYNVTISDSKANLSGGGIYTLGNIVYNNLTFINNTAKNGGGLYWDKKSVTISNMVFINNNATENGGAIYIPQDSATVQLNNFTNNTAKNSGGAIYTNSSFSGGKITSSDFTQNHADYGGAIYAGSAGSGTSHIPITGCTFTKIWLTMMVVQFMLQIHIMI